MYKVDTLILGGGIAGLLYGLYNSNCMIITDRVGGQFNSKFSLGPRILHKDDNTRQLLDDLDIIPSVRSIKVGYYYDGKLTGENTEKNRKEYFERTRGDIKTPYLSCMSGNKSVYDSYEISESDLLSAILAKNKTLMELDGIEQIDLSEKIVHTRNNSIYYNKLVSTIPANVFYKLADLPDVSALFKSIPTSFVRSAVRPDNFPDISGYDYVYVTDKQFQFHRITKVNDSYVCEFKGEIVNNDSENTIVIKTGQLIQNIFNIYIPGVTFVGRYATWNHSVKINEVLKQIYES